MARFIYRMQSILNIKYKLEEQAKQKYMEVRMRLNEAQDALDKLIQRHNQYMMDYRSLVSSHLDIMEIENCKNSILLMEQYISEQEEVIRAIELELEQAAFLMNEAMKERKIHEKLREKEFELFKQEQNHLEMKEIDQLVSYQYNGHNSNTEEL